jgi:hypothetical protein
MASARREIHDSLINTLKTITISSGYHQNVVSVTKRMKEIEMVHAFPALSVIEGEQVFQNVSEDENLYEATASFSVIGYVKTDHDATDAGLLSAAADDLIEDIKDALMRNTSVLFTQTSAKNMRFVSDEPLLDYQNNWGYVTVNFVVTYYWGSEE